jgi:hypothetical protein
MHLGQVSPNPLNWVGSGQVKKKKLKFYLQNFVTFSYFAIHVLLNIGLYFISKKYESGIKIPGFRQNFQKYKKKIEKKKKKCFCAYGQVSQN